MMSKSFVFHLVNLLGIKLHTWQRKTSTEWYYTYMEPKKSYTEKRRVQWRLLGGSKVRKMGRC